MRFVCEGKENAIDTISAVLAQLLSENHHVVWLTSGGSCIEIQVEIMQRLRQTVEPKLSFLTILPVDERYGPAGFADSNTSQMRLQGFDPGAAKWIDVLAINEPFAETISRYSQTVTESFAAAHTTIATLGMGPDAHTAGVLPDSPATTDMTSTVLGYEWSDYTRMTLGISSLLQLDQAFLLAYGATKEPALLRLRQNVEPVETLPAKLLYDVPDVSVYNDYIEAEETEESEGLS